MYPASGVSTGDILLADLPDEILVNAGGFSGSMDKSTEGVAYVSDPWFIEINENQWTLYSEAGVVAAVIGNCLITGDGSLTPGDDTVEDGFAAEYDVTSLGATVRVTRESLCVWSGADECGNLWYLFYGLGPYGNGYEYGWNVSVRSTDDCDLTEQFSGSKNAVSGEHENSPIGVYDGTGSATVAEI